MKIRNTQKTANERRVIRRGTRNIIIYYSILARGVRYQTTKRVRLDRVVGASGGKQSAVYL